MSMVKDNLRLVYIKDVGLSNSEIKEYDFYFAEDPDIFWGHGFDVEFANQGITLPNKDTYDLVLRLKTIYPLFCMQHNNCFSMQHVVNKVVAVGFEDISEYDDYPTPYRLVFKYGEDYKSVETKLAGRNQFFSEDENL